MAYKSAGGFAGNENRQRCRSRKSRVDWFGYCKFYQRRADFRSDYKKFGMCYRFPVRNDGEGNRESVKDSTLKIEKSVMPEGISVIWLADRSGQLV